MLADEQKYFSLMTRTALVVLMVVVMFWIRGQVPDPDAAKAADDATGPQTVATEHAAVPAMPNSIGLTPPDSLVSDASTPGIVTHR